MNCWKQVGLGKNYNLDLDALFAYRHSLIAYMAKLQRHGFAHLQELEESCYGENASDSMESGSDVCLRRRRVRSLRTKRLDLKAY